MTNERWVVMLLCFAPAITSLTASAQEPPTAPQLIDAAHRVSDLTKLGPYTLTANVMVDSGDKKTRKTGHLTISRYLGLVRQELEMGGEREVRVYRGDKQYIVPGLGLLSALGLKDFDESWDPVRCSRRIVSPSFKAVWRETAQGADAWCLSREYEHQEPSVCFDAAKGVFLGDMPGGQASTQFFDFIPTEDQLLYPRRALMLKDSFGRIEVDSIEVKPVAVKDDLFTPPDNAIEIDGCKSTSFPRPLYQPEPNFPERERKQKKQGVVGLSVIIDKEGNVAAAQVLKSPTEGFARQAAAVVMKWKFQPAMCAGRPVNREIYVEVDFHLY